METYLFESPRWKEVEGGRGQRAVIYRRLKD